MGTWTGGEGVHRPRGSRIAECSSRLPNTSARGEGKKGRLDGNWIEGGPREDVLPWEETGVVSQRLTGLVETTMSCPLPQEILDLIVDHLHDEQATLKTCCVVSKSWVPHVRKHLFARVEFHSSESHVKLWKETFPDPSNSPAHHTRSLSIHGTPVITAADAGADGWIRAFHNVVHLKLSYMDLASVIPFYGFTPTLRSLSLTHVPLDAFNLICSFPLLEDLSLVALLPAQGEDGWKPPSVSPKLTGTLNLRVFENPHSVTHRLLDIPGGLHFSEITTSFFDDEAESVADLVSRCSDTLELLTIEFHPDNGAFPSAPATGQYLTCTRRRV